MISFCLLLSMLVCMSWRPSVYPSTVKLLSLFMCSSLSCYVLASTPRSQQIVGWGHSVRRHRTWSSTVWALRLIIYTDSCYTALVLSMLLSRAIYTTFHVVFHLSTKKATFVVHPTGYMVLVYKISGKVLSFFVHVLRWLDMTESKNNYVDRVHFLLRGASKNPFVSKIAPCCCCKASIVQLIGGNAAAPRPKVRTRLKRSGGWKEGDSRLPV